jgi:hypothetical protein
MLLTSYRTAYPFNQLRQMDRHWYEVKSHVSFPLLLRRIFQVHKVRFVASTLLDAVRKVETAPASAARAHAYLCNTCFQSILVHPFLTVIWFQGTFFLSYPKSSVITCEYLFDYAYGTHGIIYLGSRLDDEQEGSVGGDRVILGSV